ncbi:unnamed protein product [Dibothriocephalus latus]|uniref:DH domain-containing protein n=1 Tax=Dibothriocephalus latus TaxID=60516 RepID=A0A3P6VAR5_DIBLA|nr:unnamed protein product [Dibothriocephalus latus]
MGTPVFAVRIDILTPDFVQPNESKKSGDVKSTLKFRKKVNSNISQKIKEFEGATTGHETKKLSVAPEITEESQQRIRGIFDRIKSGPKGSSVEDKEAKRAVELKHRSDELISTEQRYFETLRILKDVSNKLNTVQLEDADILRTIFKDIPSLYMLHSYMDVAFKNSQTPVDYLLWLDVFTSKGVADYFNIYKSFLSQCYTTHRQLADIYEKNKEFQELCIPLVHGRILPLIVLEIHKC